MGTLASATSAAAASSAGKKGRPRRCIKTAAAYPPAIENTQWARFANPIRPIVTDRPMAMM